MASLKRNRKAGATGQPTETAESAAVFAGSASSVLADFAVPSEEGNERQVMDLVATSVSGFGLSPDRLERLKTAVAEATMNAIEHGNGGDPSLDVTVRVEARDDEVTVLITDHGGGREIPTAEVPDLEAKLAGEQKARGWGLFLIEKMVDEMHTYDEGTHHVIELMMRRGEA